MNPNPPKILIVEDDGIVQLHLRVLAEELGYVVVGVAANGEDALITAGAHPPDLVIMDIRLKGKRDGIETAAMLRDRHDPAMVFLTAYADEESIDRAMAAGAQGYVVKPFSKPQLRAALATALREKARGRATGAAAPVPPTPLPQPERERGPARPFGPGSRVAIFSHDTLGLGHLQRCSNIARSLTATVPGVSVLLLTGSPAVHRYALPAGVDYVKLPSVKKAASEQYAARSLGVSDDDVLKLRTNLILQTLQDYDPNVLIVDHAPTGMKGEMLPALQWLGKHRPDCIRALGLRDVIDDPESVKALWNDKGIYDVLRAHYEQILIYGQENIFDTSTAYALPDDLKRKSRFCGYVGEDEEALDPSIINACIRPGQRTVAVTIGGGDGAGDLVIGNYLSMLEAHASTIGWRSIILPGPFIPEDLLAGFRERVAALSGKVAIHLLEFVTSTSPIMAKSDLVICTGGYNTTTQLLRFAKRGLLIPRIMHRQEQILRATRLAEMGLVTLFHPNDVNPESMHRHVVGLIDSAVEPLSAARDRALISFDGARAVAEWCRSLTVR